VLIFVASWYADLGGPTFRRRRDLENLGVSAHIAFLDVRRRLIALRPLDSGFVPETPTHAALFTGGGPV
jgi:hypothetical protein